MDFSALSFAILAYVALISLWYRMSAMQRSTDIILEQMLKRIDEAAKDSNDFLDHRFASLNKKLDYYHHDIVSRFPKEETGWEEAINRYLRNQEKIETGYSDFMKLHTNSHDKHTL